MKVTKRPWSARGHADHGWLYSFHTFSFASYYNPKFENFGPLRVINEDRVEKGTGFGTHSHAEFLIWSYIVSGELEHKDSMGNLEKLRRGEVQFTSAGTGIRHSEYNRNKEEVCSKVSGGAHRASTDKKSPGHTLSSDMG
jgi:redox-sensitive bicupin YhaK (pirin superfamily)